MARFKVEAWVESDRTEHYMQLYTEGVLEGHTGVFKLEDLSVYEITM